MKFRSFTQMSVFALAVSMLMSCAPEANDMSNVKSMHDVYTHVELNADRSTLDADQIKVLDKLVEAAEAIDMIFWKQQPKESLEARAALANASTDIDKLYQAHVELNYGPWDARLDQERFYGTGPERPLGAGFYAEDITKDEFTAYISAHPDQKEALESLYTIVVRDGENLKAVYYHEAFPEETQKAAQALKEASEYAKNPSLKKYLALRSEALLTDDYYESDLAWMDMEGNLLDIIIGPIETYEDGLMGLKASHEGAVMIKDLAASKNLEIYKQYLDALERNLPEDEKYKRESAGSGNILQVVNVAYFSGDYDKGVKTIAVSLPNDEKVINIKGGKKTLYKNAIDAKFDKILVPLSSQLMAPELHQFISKESFINNTLLHELVHTLGPMEVYGSGGKTLRSGLQEHYSAFEEAKADIVGIYSSKYLMEQGVYDELALKNNYVTYIAGIFRAIRFGAEEAHGRSNVIQLNYLTEKGALVKEGTTYSIDFDIFHETIGDLGKVILHIQAEGNYDGAVEMIAKYGHIPADVKALMASMSNIPVDLKLTYKN